MLTILSHDAMFSTYGSELVVVVVVVMLLLPVLLVLLLSSSILCPGLLLERFVLQYNQPKNIVFYVI